jgi:hypothetical protein
MGMHLACIAMNLANKLVKNQEALKILNKDSKYLALGLCIFLLKLFYSVGLDSPSIVNTKKSDILKYVQNDTLKRKLLRTLDFVDEKKENTSSSILIKFSRKIPSFQSMIERWTAFYNFWNSRATCVSTFKEVSSMGLEQLNSYIENKLKV